MTDKIMLEKSNYLKTPSTHSSMKVKERVWRPSPHISNLSVEVRVFRQNAAGAFSLPPIIQIQIMMFIKERNSWCQLYNDVN